MVLVFGGPVSHQGGGGSVGGGAFGLDYFGAGQYFVDLFAQRAAAAGVDHGDLVVGVILGGQSGEYFAEPLSWFAGDEDYVYLWGCGGAGFGCRGRGGYWVSRGSCGCFVRLFRWVWGVHGSLTLASPRVPK